MKKYGVRVKELHTDLVWIEADSAEEAEEKAIELAECEFDFLYDTVVEVIQAI